MSRLIALSAVLALAACNPDADGDGLTNKEEKALGLDPDNADSDGDGLSDSEEQALGLDPLSPDADDDGLMDGEEEEYGADPLNPDSDEDGLLDGEEVDNGADPLVPDTDEDGYLDLWEVVEGSDPADDGDRIYEGNWPYYYDKDDLPKGKKKETVSVGEMFGRHAEKDQFGDTFDIYDLYNEDGKYIIIDVSAQWCGPCQAMSDWVSGGNPDYLDPWYADVREAIDKGDVYWVTIMAEDSSFDPGRRQTATEWDEAFPHPRIPVMADPDYFMVNHTALRGFPHMIVLNPDLTVAQMPGFSGSYIDALDYIQDNAL